MRDLTEARGTLGTVDAEWLRYRSGRCSLTKPSRSKSPALNCRSESLSASGGEVRPRTNQHGVITPASLEFPKPAVTGATRWIPTGERRVVRRRAPGHRISLSLTPRTLEERSCPRPK